MSLEEVKRLRSSQKGWVTRWMDRLKAALDADKPAVEIEIILGSLQNQITKLENAQSRVEALSDTDEEALAEQAYVEDVLTDALDMQVRAKSKLKADAVAAAPIVPVAAAPVPVIVNAAPAQPPVAVQLPKEELPKYDGDPLKYAEFIDRFKTSVHTNASLPASRKMVYLKQCLIGSAEKALEGWDCTEASYASAFQYLEDRFGDPDVRMDALLSILLDLEKVESESNTKDLRKMIDTVESTIRSLKSLDVDMASFGRMFKLILLRRIPKNCRLGFLRSGKEQTLENLTKFLCEEIRILEKGKDKAPLSAAGSSEMEEKPSSKQKYKSDHSAGSARKVEPKSSQGMKHRTVFTVKASDEPCVFCAGKHSSEKCSKSPAERLKIASEKKLCFLCLDSGHYTFRCHVKERCGKDGCSRRHHILLHDDEKDKQQQSSDGKLNVKLMNTIAHSESVLLPVVATSVQGEHRKAKVRGILDSGSNVSFCSDELADELHMKVLGKKELRVTSFNSKEKLIHSREVVARFEKLDGSTLEVHAFTVPSLGIQQNKVDPSVLNVDELKGSEFQFGDVTRDDGSAPTDLYFLLGSDVLASVMTGKRIMVGSGLGAIETCFGWVLQGQVNQSGRSSSSIVCLSKAVEIDEDDLSQRLEAFWETEDVPKSSSQTEVALECFEKDLKMENGKYVVPLPFVDDRRPTPNGFVAQAMFKRMKNRLKEVDEYRNVFNEYVSFGAIERDPDERMDVGYFLPHHAVLRPSSDTHKVRIVFNASHKMKDGFSLNDVLETGPNILPNVATILMKFRWGAVALTGDIQKAFLTIGILPEHRKFLRLAWEQGEPMRMCRLPFGLNCAPFLLQATILIHLKKSFESGKISFDEYERIVNSFYMDDLISSMDSKEERDNLIAIAEELFGQAGMTIHKWRFADDRNDDSNTTVLGMNWDCQNDQLSVADLKLKPRGEWTKRSFLGVLSSVFDPLGVLSPLVLWGKILMQRVWKSDATGWDEVLSDELTEEINRWSEELKKVSSVKIDRWLNTSFSKDEFWIHCFVDASESGFGACVYVVTRSTSMLLTSKTRVAPLKVSSLPRLELQAAVMGVHLVEFVLKAIPKPEKIFYWSDSKVTLAWLNSPSYKWATFVANRVAEIQRRSSSDQWLHVPGTDNPADWASRGCEVESLQSDFWLHGPSWICSPTDWPAQHEKESTDVEMKKVKTVAAVEVEEQVDLFPRSSSWKKIVRLIALIRRMKTKRASAEPDHKNVQPLDDEELNAAESTLIRMIQSNYYAEEIAALKKNDAVQRSSSLWKLDPFMDAEGLLRVGGRIGKSLLNYDAQHPIILPHGDRYVAALVEDTHLDLHHGGVDSMVTSLRNKFWITKAKRLCRKVKTKCMTCKRFDGKVMNEVMAPLPEERVTLSRPFSFIGVDFAGPFMTKVRGEVTKSYLLVIVCCSTRALHLELTESLMTEDFILAFRRFVARRGWPKGIRSDNGRTFVKAAEMLKISWKFNPPHAPWWGGQFERYVQLVKKPLARVLGQALVSQKELEALFLELERTINSRPLIKPSDDVKDPGPVTPAMLLGEVFDEKGTELKFNADQVTKRMRYVEKLRKNLSRRWHDEYLGSLMERRRTFFHRHEIQVGDLAFLDTGKKRVDWPMVKITEIFRGSDGRTRAVRVQVGDTEFIRPVQRLVPLELSVPSEDVTEKELTTAVSEDVPECNEACYLPDGDEVSWVQCDRCDVWKHQFCAGVEGELAADEEFLCVKCSG